MEAALDRTVFRKVINCLGVRVGKHEVFQVRKQLGKQRILNIHNIKNVLSDEDNRIVLLSPQTVESDVSPLLANFPNSQLERREVVVDYAQLSADEVLKSLLPAGVEVPSGFETVGHLAHLNLRPEHEPYKHRIGQVLLDKSNSNLRTIINKTGVIETKFRTFPMELLAGEEDYMVEAKCNGYRFKFDYSQVYWNSKLSEEHERLTRTHFIASSKEQIHVVDAFCGVGPFAVRAATNKCLVLANDLNPQSVDSLVVNAKLNKLGLVDCRQKYEVNSVQPGMIGAFNMDAREFLAQVFHKLPAEATNIHVVMNLPAIAIEFLDAIRIPAHFAQNMPQVHCYCFSKHELAEDRERDVTERVEHVLQTKVDQIKVRTVRDVAPKKFMMCATFVLPHSTLVEEEGSKRVKL